MYPKHCKQFCITITNMFPKHCKQFLIIITNMFPKHSMDAQRNTQHTSLSLVSCTDIDEVSLHEFQFILLLRGVREQHLVRLGKRGEENREGRRGEKGGGGGRGRREGEEGE